MRTVEDFVFRVYGKCGNYKRKNPEIMKYPICAMVAFQDVEINGGIIMQWTGLLDKNGKKIFEGDIMLINNNMGTFERKAVIFWDEPVGSWAYNEYAPKRPKIFCDGVPVGEVIGNIYENPELMEGKGNEG